MYSYSPAPTLDTVGLFVRLAKLACHSLEATDAVVSNITSACNVNPHLFVVTGKGMHGALRAALGDKHDVWARVRTALLGGCSSAKAGFPELFQVSRGDPDAETFARALCESWIRADPKGALAGLVDVPGLLPAMRDVMLERAACAKIYEDDVKRGFQLARSGTPPRLDLADALLRLLKKERAGQEKPVLPPNEWPRDDWIGSVPYPEVVAWLRNGDEPDSKDFRFNTVAERAPVVKALRSLPAITKLEIKGGYRNQILRLTKTPKWKLLHAAKSWDAKTQLMDELEKLVGSAVGSPPQVGSARLPQAASSVQVVDLTE